MTEGICREGLIMIDNYFPVGCHPYIYFGGIQSFELLSLLYGLN